MTTARNRAIDRIRRDRTLAAKARLLDLPETLEDTVDETTSAPYCPCSPASSHSSNVGPARVASGPGSRASVS
jgi:DNA-directed RNA polymerase specialized sigma24 family protein